MNKKLTSALLGAAALIGALTMSLTAVWAADTRIPTDVETASEGCTLYGLKGSYIADAQGALELINRFRREACTSGKCPDPRDRSRMLTEEDYVPIRWSSDLEYIARIRAAESSLTCHHERTNGSGIFGLKSPRGISAGGEVLAWNMGADMLSGIWQWYGEKNDWWNQAPDQVTGHYTALINPNNLYTGIGTFLSEDGFWYNTTAGKFSSKKDLDESVLSEARDIVQILEVADSRVWGYAVEDLHPISLFDIEDEDEDEETADQNELFTIGNTYPLRLIARYVNEEESDNARLTLLTPVTWTSSDEEIATVSEDGEVKLLTCGDVTITAESGPAKASRSFNLTHHWDAGKVTRMPTVATKGVKTYTCVRCRTTREEDIAQLPHLTTVSKGKYSIMTTGGQNVATYLGASGKKVTAVSIPAVIKVNGIKIKVTAIAPKALFKYKALKSVTIGANIQSIGKQAFQGSRKLNKITIKSTVLKAIGAKALSGISKTAEIKVPAKKKKAYKRLLKKRCGYVKTMKVK